MTNEHLEDVGNFWFKPKPDIGQPFKYRSSSIVIGDITQSLDNLLITQNLRDLACPTVAPDTIR